MVTPRMAYVSRIIRQNAAKLSSVKQKSPYRAWYNIENIIYLTGRSKGGWCHSLPMGGGDAYEYIRKFIIDDSIRKPHSSDFKNKKITVLPRKVRTVIFIKAF